MRAGSWIVAASIALAACAGSQEKKDEGAAAPAEAGEQTRVGVITEIAGDAIAVRPADDEGAAPGVWFRRTAQSEVKRDGTPFAWALLEEGMPVRVVYEEQDGTARIRTVEVLTGEEASQTRRDAGVPGTAGEPPPPKE